MNIQNTAHFVMQSKGGAGKSVVSALLAQYLLEKNPNLMLIDTDPSNKTLSSYQALNVQRIELLNRNKLIDQSKFNGFMNEFLSNDNPMIVDTGSGDFLAINNYMITNEIPLLFTETGKSMFIHTPINFGQSREETLKCLMSLSANHQDTPIIIWENEYFGENEEDIMSMPMIKKAKNIVASIKIHKMNADTEEKYFSMMLKGGLTFNEVALSEDIENFGLVQKASIKRTKNKIWQQLDALFASDN